MPRGSGIGPNTAARIVRTIWQNPQISRVGIAERLALDKSTITNQVARLIDIGLIEEIDEGSAGTRGGRRPIHLAINRSFGRVIGIEPDVLLAVPRRIGVAGGQRKHSAIRAAVLGGWVNVLVTDVETADALLS